MHTGLIAILFTTLLPLPIFADTALDPVFGVKVSIVAMQGLLASLPPPSLEKGGFAVPVQGTYLTGKATGPMPGIGTYNATFKGNGYTAGLTSGEVYDFRFFVMAMANSMNGSVDINPTTSSFALTHLDNVKTSGQAVIAGLGYRLIGGDKSPFALGLFGGGAAFKFNSQFSIPGGYGFESTYESNPTIAGPLAGLQFDVKLGPIFINPYGFFFSDQSKCKAYDSPTNPTSDGCLTTSASFTAFGLNVGYKSLRLNAYSMVRNSQDLDSVKINAYSLSYTFGGD